MGLYGAGLYGSGSYGTTSGLYGSGLYGVGTYGETLFVAVQDSWPPRVLITATNLIYTGTSVITLYREVAGVRSIVRGADAVLTGGQDNFVRVDAELPFGVPVRYIAAIDTSAPELSNPSELVSDSVTVTIEKVAITDAITGKAAQVVIVAWPEKTSTRQATTYNIAGGRNVVVSGPRAGFSAVIDIMTESDSARENFESLLDAATSGVLQIRQSTQDGKTYGGVDSYIAVLSDSEVRWSQDGSDPRRRWSLTTVETDGWPAGLEARGFTLQDLADYFGSITQSQMVNQFPPGSTLLTIAQGDYS